MRIPQILQITQRFLTNNSPQVLTALGVVGTVGTAFLTARATVDAVRTVDSATSKTPIGKKEAVKLTWKLYIPPLSVAAVTVTSIILANRIGTRRAAAIAAAYSISEKAFEEYREQVREKIGKKRADEVEEELAQRRVNRAGAPTSVVVPGSLKVLCYDEYSSRYFESTMETIKKAQNDTNYQVLSRDECTLNEFYDRLDIPHVKFGDDVGWSTLSLDKLEVKIKSVMSEDDRPCISIDYTVTPLRSHPLG